MRRSIGDNQSLPLWRVPLARTADPETSHAAAEAIRDKLGEQHRAVLLAMHRYPGRTSRELAAVSDLTNEQIHKRRKELERIGMIEVSDQRECTVGGRMCQVYRLTNLGESKC